MSSHWRMGIRENRIYWSYMFELLSSDISKSLYQEIGLNIADKDGLVQQIRSALLKYHTSSTLSRLSLTEEQDSELADMTFNQINQYLGEAIALGLYQWGIQVFKYALVDKATYGYWVALLLRCKWDDNLWKKLELPQDKSAAFQEKFANAQDNFQFLSLVEDLSEQPLSDWDLQMQNEFNVEADDDNFLDSLKLILGSAVQIVKNQHFWQWVTQTLSVQEIHTLNNNAQQLIHMIEEFQFMESLTHPSLLVPRDR